MISFCKTRNDHAYDVYNTLRLVKMSLFISIGTSNKEFNFCFSGKLIYNIIGNVLLCLHILIKTLKGLEEFTKVVQSLDFSRLGFA